MWLTRGPLAPDELTRRFWWRFHRKEALVGVVAVVIAAGAVLTGVLWVDETEACQDEPFECNVMTEVLGTFAVAAVGVLLFVWKLRKIVRGFARQTRERPDALLGVEMPSRVAGAQRYEQLFGVIARDLLREQPSRARNGGSRGQPDHDDGARGPQGGLVPGKLIVGGAGTGKTTAMVGLTAFLAERQAVPIPISLRSQDHPINLVRLAREQFTERVETRTLFGDQGDRVFARLRARGQLVILADGLDEAMPAASRSQREVVLNAAIQDALEARVAVVATWRTAQLGRDLPLARFDLPQLKDDDAVGFLCPAAGDEDRQATIADEEFRDTIVAAQLSETPFYLTIAEPLARSGRLDDWRGDDTASLRVELLDRYVTALSDKNGPLLPDADIALEERAPVIHELSGLACAMLRRGRASVPIDDVEEWADRPFGEPLNRTPDAHQILDGGRALKLFELVGRETGQFTHSVMQSYLASRQIREATDRIATLIDVIPCDELLTAIIMAGAWHREGEDDVDRQARGRRVADALLEKSQEAGDRLGLALVTAAAKIAMACRLGSELAAAVVQRAEARWENADTPARLEAIAALAALGTEPAYHLLRVALDDREFAVRLAAAQALGEGGDVAYHLLKPELGRTLGGNGRRPEERGLLGSLGYVLPLLRCDEQAGYVPEVAELIPTFEAGLEPAIEGAIARGFKRDAFDQPDRHVDLNHLGALLDRAGWWYSKLCLLHVLTLRAGSTDEGAVRQLIRSCVREQNQHEFVKEAGRQCLAAVEAGDVKRWVWRDEPEVVRHARPTRPRTAVAEEGLAVEAVQLAAEVALAMNLTFSMPLELPIDEDRRRRERDLRVRKWLDNVELPHCIAKSRNRGEVFQPDGCCSEGCPYDFCPLGSKSAGSFWSEFSEAFCRQQQEALPRARELPTWQRGFRRRHGLRSFWDRMAEEARKASAARAPGPH
jgi:hypothetical protein